MVSGTMSETPPYPSAPGGAAVYKVTVHSWNDQTVETRRVDRSDAVTAQIAQFVTQYSGCKSITVTWQETVLFVVDGYGKPIS
jgi:hypothetical protein